MTSAQAPPERSVKILNPVDAVPLEMVTDEIQRLDRRPLVLLAQPPVDARHRLPEDGINRPLVQTDHAFLVRNLFPVEIHFCTVSRGVEAQNDAKIANSFLRHRRCRRNEDAPRVEYFVFCHERGAHERGAVVDERVLPSSPDRSRTCWSRKKFLRLQRDGLFEPGLRGCREKGMDHEAAPEVIAAIVPEVTGELELADGLDAAHRKDIAVRLDMESARRLSLAERSAGEPQHVLASPVTLRIRWK